MSRSAAGVWAAAVALSCASPSAPPSLGLPELQAAGLPGLEIPVEVPEPDPPSFDFPPPPEAEGAPKSRHPGEVPAGDWVEVSTGPFVIVGDGGEEDVSALAHRLGTFRRVVHAVSNARETEPRVPTAIYRISDPEVFGRLVQRPDEFAGWFRAGADGNLVVMTERDGFEELTLFHEYVHFVVRNEGAFRLPLWYNEGLADFVSTVGSGRGLILGLVHPLRWPWIKRNGLLPLDTILDTRSYAALEGDDLAGYYATSWLLVHYLHMRRRDEMLRLLALYGHGQPIRAAIRAALGMDVAELADELRVYSARETLPGLRLPGERFEGDLRVSARSLGGAAVAARLGEAAFAFARLDQAGGFLEAALRLDPELARAHVGMARIRTTQGDWEAAESHAKRALALAPEDASSHQAYAESILVHMSRRHWLDMDDRGLMLEEARRHYARSIELAPDQPAAYAGMGFTYLFDGGDVREGIRSLERARELLGSDNAILFHLAELYYRDAQLARARALLEEVIAWAHHGGMGGEAQALLEEMDRDAGMPPGG